MALACTYSEQIFISNIFMCKILGASVARTTINILLPSILGIPFKQI